MSILFLLVTVLPVTLTVFIIISFFCFCINCSPEPHADSVNIQQYLRKYSWFYYINVTTFHLAVIMMILFWQDRLPLYAHLCVYIFILMKGYPLMTLITFDPQTPRKTGDRRNHLRNSCFSIPGYIILQYQCSHLSFSICH